MPDLQGFREVEHTADWELEVWAADLPGLLEQAALGMYALAGVRLQNGPRHTRTVAVRAQDGESLLVKFLSELLYLGTQEGLAFDALNLRLEGDTLQAELTGAPIAAQDKEIKAVTFHNLAIRQSARGLVVNVVFDV
jgi:SHS2 domain-containing protein